MYCAWHYIQWYTSLEGFIVEMKLRYDDRQQLVAGMELTRLRLEGKTKILQEKTEVVYIKNFDF